jgi:chemotaxis protein MotB
VRAWCRTCAPSCANWAPALNGLPNKITLSGHTDAIVYTNDRSYGNWELSADRANASRRELMIGGMTEGKVLRVIGLADSMHLDKAEPRNPINRRISIILLNHRTQSASSARTASNPWARASANVSGQSGWSAKA